MTRSDYADKTVVVIGMARTGVATVEALKSLGANVIWCDSKPASELTDSLADARRMGVEARPGTDVPDYAGVDLVVTSPGVRATAAPLLEAQRKGVPVISEIELAYQLSPAPIIAVTGTNGKTTTTVLIGRMLQADGRDTYIAGNVAAGDLKLPLVAAAMQARADSAISAEISTFQLEWIQSFRPKVGLLLNIGRDHEDRQTPEEYAALKASLFRYQNQDDFAVLNADNSLVMTRTADVKSRKLLFSRLIEPGEGAFVRGDDLILRLNGTERTICARGDIRIPGEHNVENVLAASLAASAFGACDEAISSAIREFNGVEHRMELVDEIDGVRYINNSMCTNVEAIVRSIEAMDRPVVVIAGGKDKGSDWSPFGEVVKHRVKRLVLIGASAPILEEAVRGAGYGEIDNASSLQEAFELARSSAQVGDAVLLAPGCASFDMFKSFEERGDIFKRLVREARK